MSGPPGGPVHLLGEPLPVPGGEQEVEEPLRLRGELLLHQPLREQDGESAVQRVCPTEK